MTLPTNIRKRLAATAAAAVLALAAWPGPARAASAPPDDVNALKAKLEQTLKLVQELSARVQALEAQKAATPAPAPAAPAAEPQKVDELAQRVGQLESSTAAHNTDTTGLPMHGFADVSVGTRNPINPGLKGFGVGNLDFYLNPQVGDRVRTLFELNTEISSEGETSVDLERAQIGYQFSDSATLWMGRFHTPFGYVNTALHHGAWINNALRRPWFLQFEDNGGILPAHTVGLWLTGAQHHAGGKLAYDLYVGNTPEIAGGILDYRAAGTPAGHMAVGGRAGWMFNDGAADGLTVGVHAYSARVEDDAVLPDATRVLAYGLYAVYDTDNFEHIAEYYRFDDEDLNGGTGRHQSNAGFVQLGWRLAWGVPYVRFERTQLNQADPYFAAQASGGSYRRSALGMRYDVTTKAAIKLEIADTKYTDRTVESFSEGLMQYAIRF